MRNTVILLYLTACMALQAQDTTFLDQIPFGEIINDYGPPKRNQSFAFTPLNINGEIYSRGLGVNAPARLTLDLNGHFTMFSAEIGVDSASFHYHTPEGREILEEGGPFGSVPGYIYNGNNQFDFTQGGSVIFKILADGREIYNSGIITKYDDARFISMDVSGVNQLTLIAEDAGDGAFADFADWNNAFLLSEETNHTPTMYCHPTRILLNHNGFHPQAVKRAFISGTDSASFQLIKSSNNKEVYAGNFIPAKGADLGQYSIAEFTSFTETGHYYIRSGSRRSETFRIHENVYKDALEKHLSYVSSQRSGHPDIGWNPAQHLDDGIAEDTREYLPLFAGWYDANDVRKHAKGTTHLLDALAEIALTNKEFSLPALLDEIRWGNLFLHAFQSQEGYIYTSLGFGKYMNSDNRWTDNVKGTADDRIVVTDPAPDEDQYRFVLGQAKASLVFRQEDPQYADSCLQAALACWNWLEQDLSSAGTNELSLLIESATYLYLSTNNPDYRLLLDEAIKELLSREVFIKDIPLVLYKSENDSREIYSNAGIMSVMRLYAKYFPDADNTVAVNAAMERLTEYFIKNLQEANAFSLMPWLLSENFKSYAPVGDYHYRYFLHVGTNGNLAFRGYEAVKGFGAVADTILLNVAHAHLDWIYGANPFNASTVFGIGQNQPALFKPGADYFPLPHTPIIPGGVMTGIGADADDNPALFPGYWWTTEYWAPTVAKMLLLVNAMDIHYKSDTK